MTEKSTGQPLSFCARGLRAAIALAFALGIGLVVAPLAGASGNYSGALSDGTKVFFETEEQLVSADTDSQSDLYERSGGQATLLVSAGEINGNGANGAFYTGASSDGTKVFFGTDEQLVSADTDSEHDVYERSGGQTKLVSAGEINGNGAINAFYTGASSDGTKVFFETGEQLVSADTDSVQDVYERSGGQTKLISAGEINGNGGNAAGYADASSDGTKVFFGTDEQLVSADTDSVQDTYERSGGQTTLVSAGEINGNGANLANFADASSDGTKVFFGTGEQLVSADTDSQTDVYERSGGQTKRVSAGEINGNGGQRRLLQRRLERRHQGLLPDRRAAGERRHRKRDRRLRALGRADEARLGGRDQRQRRQRRLLHGASSDGTKVFFGTDEQLVSADTDSEHDVYERSGGQTTLVSAGEINGNGANGAAYTGASSDGTKVFFETNEQLVSADTDSETDVYERSGGQTKLVSAGEISGNGANEAVYLGASSDGTKVFFGTDEQLVSADTDSEHDVYERSGGQTTAISLADVDDLPTAVNDAKTVDEDAAAATIDVLANDTDPDGGALQVDSVGTTAATHGSVQITNSGADLTYAPDPNYCNSDASGPGSGPDASFTYTLNGGSSATVSVLVSCVDDAVPPGPTDPAPGGGSGSGGDGGGGTGGDAGGTGDGGSTDGDDVLTGTDLGDLIDGLTGDDLISGGLGDDRLFGGDGDDEIDGGDGDDLIRGGKGNDKLDGGKGNDKLDGGKGNDKLDGGKGNDKLDGGKGKDKIFAGPGNDKVTSDDGEADKVNCGKGKDTVDADDKDKIAKNCEKVR